MKKETMEIYENLFKRYPILEQVKEKIEEAFNILLKTFENGGTLYVSGNGGSAADSEHIVGELLKKFKKHRNIDSDVKTKLEEMGEDGKYITTKLEGSLPAVSLISQSGILTAYANDESWDCAIAQQLYGLSRKGDTFLAISTSGNSKNCTYAAMVARSKGVNVISLTGKAGGRLMEISDVCINAPEEETYKVQELHLPIYHCLCAMLEEEIF